MRHARKQMMQRVVVVAPHQPSRAGKRGNARVDVATDAELRVVRIPREYEGEPGYRHPARQVPEHERLPTQPEQGQQHERRIHADPENPVTHIRLAHDGILDVDPVGVAQFRRTSLSPQRPRRVRPQMLPCTASCSGM